MSIPYTNYTNFRLPETSKSGDTSDEANRRREMRRRQQSATIKIQNQSRIDSKKLLDEVLGKEFVQSKSKSLANQPDIGRHHGLPVPAQLKGGDLQSELDDQRNFSDFDAQSSKDEAKQFTDQRDRSVANGSINSNKSANAYEAAERATAAELADADKLTAMNCHSTELNEASLNNLATATDVDIDLEASPTHKKFTSSPLSMLNAQLDKLKNEILLIDENRCQNQLNRHDLAELADQQTRMATSLEFLEGYAEGIIKDQAGRQQFEQSCKDLRDQLVQSQRNFSVALENTLLIQANQANQLIIQPQSQKGNETSDRILMLNKRQLDERSRQVEDSYELQAREDEQKSSRLDDTNSTQRVRSAKLDRDNAESTLPLLVQRSV